MINSLALAYMGSQQAAEQQPKSILDEAVETPAQAPSTGAPASLPSTPLPAGQTPPTPASGGDAQN